MGALKEPRGAGGFSEALAIGASLLGCTTSLALFHTLGRVEKGGCRAACGNAEVVHAWGDSPALKVSAEHEASC